MFPWSDAPAEESPTYAVGSTVYSGGCRGTVVSLDPAQTTLGIVWSDGKPDDVIMYPADATYIRKAMPWETQ